MLDFVERISATSFSRKQFEVLVAAGAFDQFGHSRPTMLEAADYIMRRIQRREAEANSGQVSLFAAAPQMGSQEPLKLPDTPEAPALERLQQEFAAVGFYLSAHPVDSYKDFLDKKSYCSYQKVISAKPAMINAKMAGVVVRKQEKRSDRGRFAFVTVSDATGVFDVTVYTEPLMQFRDCFNPGNLIAMTVDVQWREEEARYILRTAEMLDQLITRSINQIHIKITPQADLEKLAKFLSGCRQGNMKVSLDVPLQTKDVATVALQAIKLQEPDIQALRRMSGVEVIAN